MRSMRSISHTSRLVHIVGIILILAAMLATPPGTLLAAPGADSGDTGVAPGAAAATGQPPQRIYLPIVLRDHPGKPSVFGVQMYGPLNSPKAALVLAQHAGIAWVRWPTSWADIEPRNTTPAGFNWTTLDADLLAAARHGLKVILTIDGNPGWAATYGQAGIIDLAPLSEFVEFVRALVERYDGDGQNDAPGSPTVQHFEFYNEPDVYGVYRWGDNGDKYAEMLCAAYPAVKAASPRAKVLMGGIAYDYFTEEYGPFVREFLDRVLTAGGGRCMDYMVFHYYPWFGFRWEPYGPGISGKTEYLRGKLREHGVGHLPIMITEAGFFSNHNEDWYVQPVNERLQSSYLVKFFTQAIASDVHSMTWWSWTDIYDFPDAYGLLTLDLQAKESYFALSVAAKKLDANNYVRRLTDSELGATNIEAYLFAGAKPFYVAWTMDRAERQIYLPGSLAEVRNLLDVSQGTITDAGDGKADGRLRLMVGPTPVYVEITQ